MIFLALCCMYYLNSVDSFKDNFDSLHSVFAKKFTIVKRDRLAFGNTDLYVC